MMQFLRQDQKNPSIFTLLSWDTCSLDTPSPKAPCGLSLSECSHYATWIQVTWKGQLGVSAEPNLPIIPAQPPAMRERKSPADSSSQLSESPSAFQVFSADTLPRFWGTKQAISATPCLKPTELVGMIK